MRAFAAVVLALTLFSAPAHAAATKRLDLSSLARTLVKEGSPGAILYVRTPTATRAGVAGFADRSAHLSMRAADRYRIASVSKAFVSVLVLQLEAAGKLDIDDSVEKSLPGLVPNGTGITLRQLLNHTSGLFDYTEDPTFGLAVLASPGRVWSPRELLAYGLAHPRLFTPGADYSYSNTNYVSLGLVVETVTGKPLGQVLQEQIFTPLALTSTSFPLDIALGADFVHGYASVPGLPGLTDVAPLLNPTFAWAAGGIVSNARDVTAFYKGLLNGKLLPAAQLAEMEDTGAHGYGLGIASYRTRCGVAVGHVGDLPGWRNEVLALRNGKRQAVVMVNVDASRIGLGQIDTFAERVLCRG